MSRWPKRFFYILLLAVGAVLAAPTLVLAQSPEPTAAGPSVFGNMPGIVYLVVPLAIAGAIYLSYELGRTDDASAAPRRLGAVSRTLARQKEED